MVLLDCGQSRTKIFAELLDARSITLAYGRLKVAGYHP
jgi:hypothetical protein